MLFKTHTWQNHYFGYKTYLPPKDKIEEYKRVIDMLLYLGYNTLTLELVGAAEYKSHPEINEGNITAEQLRACCDRLRAAGIEPVPLYNCYGHQGWNSRNGFLKAYPEFDEAPHIPDENLIAKEHIWDGEKWLSSGSGGEYLNTPEGGEWLQSPEGMKFKANLANRIFKDAAS